MKHDKHSHSGSDGDKSPSPIIYLIRHGEKDPKLADGEDPVGLSTLGIDRAQGLVGVFGPNSQYDIRYILAQAYKSDGKRERPYLTIKPLAEALGDSAILDASIDRDKAEKVAKAVRKYEGPGNILICWEHKQLDDIVQAIGVEDAQPYPDDRFDVIWTLEAPYNKINCISSEHIPGLDDKYASEPAQYF